MADQSIGKAIIVNGTVKAQSADGVERVLQPNSPVFLNDRINTGAEGAISIGFNDPENTQLDLGRMTEMVIDNSVLAAEEVDLEEVTAEVAAIQQALESGDEIQIAETAAGPSAGGAGDGGGGRPIYKDEIDGKEGDVTSGAETEGVDYGFTGVLLDVVEEPEVVPFQVTQLSAPEPDIPEPEPEPLPEPEPDPDPDPELFPPVDYDVAAEADFFQELPFTFAEDFGGGTGSGTEIDFGAGYLYEFQVGEAEIVSDNIHGTDIEDGVTTQFTITSLPTADGLEEEGVLLVDRGDNDVIEEIYGEGFDPLPAGGLNVQTGDSVYYFLEEGMFDVLPDSVSFEYFTTDSDGLVSDGAVITVTFEDIPEAFPGEVAVDEDGLDGGNPGTAYIDGSDLAGDNSAETGILNYDFGDNGPHPDTPFSWSTAGLPAVTSAGADVIFDVISDGLQLVGHTGEVGDPVLTLSLVDINTREYEFEVLKPLDHDTANTEDDIVFNFGYTVMDGDGDESSSVLTAAVDDDSPELTGEYQSHQVEEEGLGNFDPDHNVDGDSIEGSAGNEDITGDQEFGGPGLVTATGDLSAMVSGGVDEPLTFGFVDDVQTALESANSGLTSQEEELNYSVDSNVLTATSDDGRVVFTLELTDTSTGAYEFTLIDQLDHASPPPGTAVENSLTLNLGAALEAVDSDGDAVNFGAILVDNELQDGVTVEVADDIPVANPVETIPTNMNLVLVLDNSGSMYNTSTNSWDPSNVTRADALKSAVTVLLTSLAADSALGSVYQVHIVEYNSGASPVGVGTFTIAGGTPGSAASAVSALGTLQNPNTDNIANNEYTNYEAGFQQALYWVNNGDLLESGDVVGDLSNQLIFFSDGDPNKFNNPDFTGTTHDFQPGGGSTTNAATALAQVTGSGDGTNELTALADAGFTVRSVGLSVNGNQAARLSQLDSTGTAENISSTTQLIDLLPNLVSDPITLISAKVEEDDLNINLDATDDLDATAPTDDSADGINEDPSTDADEADDLLSGNLNELFMSGADENLTFSLNPTGDLPTLYSGGQEVSYDFSTPGMVVASAGGTTVFTFSVGESDGTWSFDLDGTLDHVEGGGENLELQTDGEPVNGIDLSSIILATDADGDSVTATPGAFVIQVEDDAPVAEGDIGYAFGYSSYTNVGGEDIQGIPPSVEFDVLSNDKYGSDGPENGASQVSIVNQNGAGIVSLNDNNIVFEPTPDWTGQTEIIYEITDGDGDTSQATLTVIENKLIVGQNVNDVDPGIDDLPYVVGEGSDGQNFGTIDGGAGNDILIGDKGGTGTSVDDLNLMLILDISGSMLNGSPDSRLDEMERAVNNLLDDVASGNIVADAQNVRVHVVTFGTTATAGTTYIVKENGVGTNPADFNFSTYSSNLTNYEDGMHKGLDWIYTNWPQSDLNNLLDAPEGTDGPLADAANQVLFLSDGAPNRRNVGDDDDEGVSSGSVVDHYEGTYDVTDDQYDDFASEVAALQAWGNVEAVGIELQGNTGALDLLGDISTDGTASNVTLPTDLNSLLPSIVEQTYLEDVGDDTILGGGGDDLIYGDALFTDMLATDVGLTGYEGAGWAVFEQLESGTVAGHESWTRTDTINYILEHQAELAQETTTVDDPDGRQGGEDTLDGGAGEDVIFGQEGDDDISGGADNDLLVGGTGEDDIDGDAGNDLLVGDAIEIIPDDGDNTDLDSDPDGIDVVEDGAVDELDGGTDSDVSVDAAEASDPVANDTADVETEIVEGDTAEIGGEEIDPLILLIPEDPGAV